MSRPIYLDSLATTPIAPEVLDAMLPWLREAFGNASSNTHEFGWEADEAVEAARDAVATLLGARWPSEITFTSGATESNNTVVQGIPSVDPSSAANIVTSALEHSSVLAPCSVMATRGVSVEIVMPDAAGVVDPCDVERALRPDTRLVSVMAANNEIGTIQPIAEIAAVAQSRGVIMHVDASQAVGKVDFDVEALGLDAASMSGHKIYGPKGIGVLYIRSGSQAERMSPLLFGGGQERGVRAGTLAVAQIVGLGAAAQLAAARLEDDARRIAGLRDALWRGLQSQVSDVRLNGSEDCRLPGCLNFSVLGVPSDGLIAAVPELAISSGSACSSREGGSHVLEAIGLDGRRQREVVRIGISRFTTLEEIRVAEQALARAIIRLRGDRR